MGRLCCKEVYRVAFVVAICLIAVPAQALTQLPLSQKSDNQWKSAPACAQLYTDKSLNPIRGKISIDGENITPEMAHDITTPTSREVAALKTYARINAQCIYQMVISTLPGGYKTQAKKDELYSNTLDQQYESIGPLIKRQINYGRYNRNMLLIDRAGRALEQSAPMTSNSSPATSPQASAESSRVTLNCALSNQYGSDQFAAEIDYTKKTVNGISAVFSENYITIDVPHEGSIIHYVLDRLSGYMKASWKAGGVNFVASGLCNRAKPQF
jgi:hypothetical protein